MIRYLLLCILGITVTSCFKIPLATDTEIAVLLEPYGEMPEIAGECSGILLEGKELLIMNDGGNGTSLHRLNLETLDSLGSVPISGIFNRDWEAMTRYEDQIVIGDFGNNFGRRMDLTIYHIDQDWRVEDSVRFAYPDQEIFDNPNKHNYDCEAFLVLEDQYVLFTKNRGDDLSNIYTAPVRESDFTRIDSITLRGDVTDAIYHEESETILLLCYQFSLTGFKNSLALVKKFGEKDYRTVEIFPIDPPEQFESIVQIDRNKFLIASELSFLKNGRKVYELTINGL